MLILFEGVTEYLTHGFHRRPEPANDDLRVLKSDTDPADALRLARRVRARLRRENAERMTLMSDPERRKLYDEVAAFERCILWHHFTPRG